MTLPYTIVAGTSAAAAPVQYNFNNLDVRLSSVESSITNLVVTVDTLANGVYVGGLIASTVGNTQVYTAGGLVVNHTYYHKTTLIVDFTGEASDTFYIEVDSAGEAGIYTSNSATRTNLNTVVWNGAGFDSVTEVNRTILYGDSNFVIRDGYTGGQTISGDTAASGNLILQSTYNATKGVVKVRTASIQHKITNQTTTTLAVSDSHNLIIGNTTSNAITITLPDASTVLGQEYTIFALTINGTDYITINTASGDTLNATGNNRAVLDAVDEFITIVAISASRWIIKINSNATLSTV